MTIGELTTINEVKMISRMTNEISDEEIADYQEAVNQEIIADYGYPFARVSFSLDNSKSIYLLNKYGKKHYKIDRVYLDGNKLNESLWTDSPATGEIILSDEIYQNIDYNSKGIVVDLIPMPIHLLAKYITGRDLLESQFLVTSQDGSFPRVNWFNKKIEVIIGSMIDSPMISPSDYANWSLDDATSIDQENDGEEIVPIVEP